MTRENRNPKTTEHDDNEGGREFGHVHVPSQTQEASERHGLADDVMPDKTPQQGTQNRQSSAMNRRGSGAQQGKPPGKSPRNRGEHKKAA